VSARCDFSDLLVDQCGCPKCRPDLDALSPENLPQRWLGSETEARFGGNCGHCGERFSEGAVIVAADVDGNGASDEWCLLSHTIRPFGGLP
jgi:hypothetical protein